MKTEPTYNSRGRAAFIQQGEQILSLVESANALHRASAEIASDVVSFVPFNYPKPKSPMATEPKPNLNTATHSFKLNLMFMELVEDKHSKHSGNEFTYIEEGSSGFGSYSVSYINSLDEPSPYIKSFINDLDEDRYSLKVEEYYRLDPELGEDWKDNKPYRAEYNDMNQYEADRDAWSRAKPTDGYSSVNVFVINK